MTESVSHAPESTPPDGPVPASITAAGAEAVAAWQEFVAEAPPKSRQQYRQIAGTYLRWLEARGTPLLRVTPDAVADFLDRPVRQRTTRYAYATALRRLFAVMVRRGILPANPVYELRIMRQAARRRASPLTPAELKGYVHELVLEPVEESSEEFAAALVLLAGVHLGTKRIMPVSRVTGVRPRLVAVFAERLRASGVWTDDGKTAGEWTNEESGRVAFWIDVLVAEGLVEIRGGHRLDQPVIAL